MAYFDAPHADHHRRLQTFRSLSRMVSRLSLSQSFPFPCDAIQPQAVISLVAVTRTAPQLIALSSSRSRSSKR